MRRAYAESSGLSRARAKAGALFHILVHSAVKAGNQFGCLVACALSSEGGMMPQLRTTDHLSFCASQIYGTTLKRPLLRAFLVCVVSTFWDDAFDIFRCSWRLSLLYIQCRITKLENQMLLCLLIIHFVLTIFKMPDYEIGIFRCLVFTLLLF
jgi:hypothetical protein